MDVYDGISQARRVRFAEWLLPFLNGAPRECRELLLSEGIDINHSSREWRSDAVVDALVKALCDTLRYRVDEWVDSAKNGIAEQPWNRIIPFDALNQVIHRHPLNLEQSSNGQPRLSMWPRYFRKKPDGSVSGEAVGWDTAMRFFLALLDSPQAVRLSRCDVCRTYFLRKRNPKRDTVIHHGSFCLKHKGKGGAERTAESRKRRKNQLIELAAEWWPQWKQTRRHGKRSVWVANQVNQRLPRWATAITGKWVTQHQDEIEAEVERKGTNYATREETRS